MVQRQKTRPRLGLILSGGGARGLAHIGVLRAMEDAGIRPDLIAGTSMGAIVGSLYAAGHSADQILEIARSVKWRDVFDLSLQVGLLKGEKLADVLAVYLPPVFKELQTPLAVTTTDMESGEQVVLTEGDLITAVRASSCFPGAFEPVELDGRMLMDGAIINNLPVEAASWLGATRTIASNVTEPRRSEYTDPFAAGTWWERIVTTVRLERRTPIMQVLLRSTDIMQALLTDIQYTLHPADLHIRMALPGVRLESFWALEDTVAEGERAAREAFAGFTAHDPAER